MNDDEKLFESILLIWQTYKEEIIQLTSLCDDVTSWMYNLDNYTLDFHSFKGHNSVDLDVYYAADNKTDWDKHKYSIEFVLIGVDYD